MLRAVIVDDEPLARERLHGLIHEADVDIDVIGEAGDGKSAVPLIHELRPDVVFLDVQMPVLDGFDVVDLLSRPKPHVIFVTAYDEYALRAFDVHALDYLTKPVRLERLEFALQRASELVGFQQSDRGLESLQQERTSVPLSRLTLRMGPRLRVVNLSDVRYIEAQDKLVFVHIDGASHSTDFTLKYLEARLNPDLFVRIHRAYMVNINVIRELVPWFSGSYQLVLNDGAKLPVARRRIKALKACLGSR